MLDELWTILTRPRAEGGAPAPEHPSLAMPLETTVIPAYSSETIPTASKLALEYALEGIKVPWYFYGSGIKHERSFIERVQAPLIQPTVTISPGCMCGYKGGNVTEIG